MELNIKNIALEDYTKRKLLYSKNIRGNFDFIIEPHILDKGKIVQINFFRNEQDIKSLLEDWHDSGDLRITKTHINEDCGALRLYINDDNVMINNGGQVNINVIEYNYSPKKQTKIEKGKVAIMIEIQFMAEVENVKLKPDLKKLVEEDNNEGTNNSTIGDAKEFFTKY